MLELSHKKLEVWKLGLELVKEVYQLTAKLPREETFGLTAQMRRSSVSVVSNLAEGAARKSQKEKVRFFEVSRSSLVELDTQVQLCLTLNYFRETDLKILEPIVQSVFKILSKLISNAEQKNN
ncbi:MAG: four helix bundle protein [Chitinophagales bacterium]